MQIRVDVYDVTGLRVGEGPITTAQGVTITRALDGAGSVSITTPARDARARALLVNEARVRVWVDDRGAMREVARGIIRDVDYQATPGGWTLTASGPDMLDELKRRNVKFGRSYVNTPLREIVADLVALVPGWRAVCSIDTPYTGRFDAATVLKALQSLVGYQGAHFRYRLGADEMNVLEVGEFGTDAGVRLVNPEQFPHPSYENRQVVVASDFRVGVTSAAVANRLYALGAGQNVDAALDLGGTTRGEPPVQNETVNGRTLYYIEDAASIAQYGLIEHVGQFKEIAPLDNTEALQVLAKNALHDAAAEWLRRYAWAQAHYTATIPSAGVTVWQGDRITVDYVDVVDDGGALIDIQRVKAACWVMRATERFDEGGSQLSLELSDVDRYEESTAKVVVGALEQIRLQNVVVQPSFNHYTYGPEQLEVDNTNPGTVQLIITDKTYRVVQVLMRVRTQPFTSTARGAGSVTSAGGGDHNHRVLVPTGISGFPFVERRPYYARGSSGGTFVGVALETAGGEIWTESSSGTHTHTIPAAPLQYGIYKDTQRPGSMSIVCNGQPVASGVGATGSDYDATFDITESILSRVGGWRGVHNVVISPAAGQGEVLVTFDVYELITPTLSAGSAG